MLDKLTSANFEPFLRQGFRVHLESRESLEVELIEVSDLAPPAPGSERSLRGQPFCIVFRGPKDVPLPQKIYRVDHEKTGPLELFLVPIGPCREGLCYEAVFN